MTKKIEASPQYNKTNQIQKTRRIDITPVGLSTFSFHKNGSVKKNNRWSITRSRIIIGDEHMLKTTTLPVSSAHLGPAYSTLSPNENIQYGLKKHKHNNWKSKSPWFSKTLKLLQSSLKLETDDLYTDNA